MGRESHKRRDNIQRHLGGPLSDHLWEMFSVCSEPKWMRCRKKISFPLPFNNLPLEVLLTASSGPNISAQRDSLAPAPGDTLGQDIARHCPSFVSFISSYQMSNFSTWILPPRRVLFATHLGQVHLPSCSRLSNRRILRLICVSDGYP